ncbi:hypothetical protein V6N11_018587 [Hibiscus sabdariffa]|uniref:Uncharacterized protein n=1 Tax=Hibiscus sabdariffa TaxID=183260 RepID=A0ABR1ZIT4_9ROSI
MRQVPVRRVTAAKAIVEAVIAVIVGITPQARLQWLCRKRDASRLFWNMCQHPSKDAVTYTTIITAYCTIDNIVKAADLVYAKLEVWMLPALFCRS